MKHWPILPGLVLGVAALAYGVHAGKDEIEGYQLAARYTARVGFPLLILIFTASALVRLWPAPMTRALMRDRRWWGLGFALCHTVHIIAFITYFRAQGQPVPLLGAPVYVLMYLMVVTSTVQAQRLLGVNWKRLHKAGIYALWGAFTFAYLGKAVSGMEQEVSVPFAVIAIAALALRIIAHRTRPVGLRVVH